jgi:VCBS repeat-containing protein
MTGYARVARRWAVLIAAIGLVSLVSAGPAAASGPSFVRAFAKDVGGSGVDVCTTASGCESGATDHSAGAINDQNVALDSSGNVYVADFTGSRVSVFDPSGNFIRAFGKGVNATDGSNVCTALTGCQQGVDDHTAGSLGGTTGVAVSGSDNVYVTDQNNHRVSEFTADGTFVRAFGKDVGGTGVDVCTTSCEGGTAGPDAGAIEGAWSLAVSGSSDVYVSDLYNNRVAEYTQTGSFVRAFGKGVNTNDGSDVCTAASGCQAGSTGDAAGQLNGPYDVAVSGGEVYVVDNGNQRIVVFTTAGAFARAFAKGVNASDGSDVCTAASGCRVGSAGGSSGQLQNPLGVAVTSSEVYVADQDNQRIDEFTTAGTFIRAFGKNVGGTGIDICAMTCAVGNSGSAAGQFNTPRGVAVGTGDIYVADIGNSRVDEYSPYTTPAVSLTAPANGTTTNDSSPTFSGTGSTAAGDDTSVTVKIWSGSTVGSGAPDYTVSATRDGSTGAYSSSGPYTKVSDASSQATLPDGTYTARAFQSDSSADTGQSTETPTFTIDASAPSLSLTTPSDGATTGDSSPEFAGTGGTASGDDASVTVKIWSGSSVGSGAPDYTASAARDGSTGAYSTSGPYTKVSDSSSVATLPDGTYTARAFQSDAALNTGQSTQTPTFTIDTAAPSVSLTAPGNGATTGDSSPEFAGTGGTAAGDDATVTVKIWAGSSVGSGDPDYTVSATRDGSTGAYSSSGPYTKFSDASSHATLPDGTYTARAFQSDAALNTGQSTQTPTFTIDTAAPSVALTAPANGTVTSDSSPGFAGTGGTAAGDDASVTVKIWAGSSVGSGAPDYTVSAARDGSTGAYSSSGPYTKVSDASSHATLPQGTYTARAFQSDAASNNGQSSQTPTFTINTAPVAVDDSASTPEDTAVSKDAAHGVLANDTDGDGDALTAVLVSGPAHGSLTLNADGSYTYTPAGNYNGPDSFSYKANDGTSDSASNATVSIDVTAVDDPPAAVNDSATVAQDGSAATIDVLANDTDPDGGPKTIASKTNGSHGTVAISHSGADLTYKPDAGYCNSASGDAAETFTYTLNGGSTATVTVNVTCTDTDGDGTPDRSDPDIDGDGVPNAHDAFPLNKNESLDTDGDGTGNNADSDDDGDGVPDAQDALPLNKNESLDTDGDGIGNNADSDDDGDGVPDAQDALPLNKNESLDTDGDGIGNNADDDDDNDGVPDSQDSSPLDPTKGGPHGPAEPPVVPTRLAIYHRGHLTVRNGFVALRLRCSGAVDARCVGALLLDPAPGKTRLAGAGAKGRYGKATFNIPARKSPMIRVKATTMLLKNLRTRHHLITLATANYTGRHGGVLRVERKLTLALAKH